MAHITTTSADTSWHQVTYLHATVTAYEPHPDGGAWVYHYVCEHHHTSDATAQACASRIANAVKRGRPLPAGTRKRS